MKERLDQLTLAQFVDLLCGDTSVLLSQHEVGNTEKMAAASRAIVMEYRAIADPSGTNAFLRQGEGKVRSKMGVVLYTLCQNLVAMKQYDKVREVFVGLGIAGAARWSDSRVDGTVTAKLAQARREAEETDTEEDGSTDVRRQFDIQTASLMAYFKFQIDPGTVKASLYAHLVARHNREIKAQLAAMHKQKQKNKG